MLTTDNKTGSYSISKLGFFGGWGAAENYSLGPATGVMLWKSSEAKERKLFYRGKGEVGRGYCKQKVYWRKLGS